MKYIKASVVIFLFFLFTAFSFAEGSTVLGLSIQSKSGPFKLSSEKDGLLLGTGALLSGGDLILDNVLEVNKCEYKGDLYEKQNINGFDRPFMNEYSSKLDNAGDLAMVASMLAPAVLLATDKDNWITIGVMYAETLLIANGVKEMAKLCVNRARPYMYYSADTYPEEDIKDGDWANSFPSGHSTMAFAGASFATYTFAQYFPDSPWKWGVGIGSYSLAAGTAALRMASGNHFASDVISGAALGTGIGILIPWLHKFNQNKSFNINAAPDGLSFTVYPGFRK